MKTPYPLAFSPIFKERVWGGRKLATLFGKHIPASVPIGESWEITDRPEGVSVVANGPLAGMNLRTLLEQHGRMILGREPKPGERFPWLVKILDANEDLSLQVHPPAHLAASLGGEPKTEMWYVVDARENATFHVGLKPGVTREEFEVRTRDGSVAQCFHRNPVKRGDVMFLPSGRVHALGGGNVVFEVQQNSDTTYRVFDWNRKGLDGKPRELHLEQAFASIDFQDTLPALLPETWSRIDLATSVRPLIRHPLFGIDVMRYSAGGPQPLGVSDGPRVLGCISGRFAATGGGERVEVAPGGFVLLPAAGRDFVIEPGADSEVLAVSQTPAS